MDAKIRKQLESLLFFIRLKRFLEQLFQCPVDVVRIHKHMNPYLLDNIEEDEFTSSNERNRIKSTLEQIRTAIAQLKEWNEGVNSADDYYMSSDGMQNRDHVAHGYSDIDGDIIFTTINLVSLHTVIFPSDTGDYKTCRSLHLFFGEIIKHAAQKDACFHVLCA
ncbi:MAG: hypothetical protein IJ190_04430 [Prevotella sp.]|nr:hypothetical protein [Prevotella sp.]